MPEKKNQQSIPPENTDMPARENPVCEADPSSCNGKNAPPNRHSFFLGSVFKKNSNKLDSAIPETKFKKGFKKGWAALGAFLESLDEEAPEPSPPPEKPLKESIQEFIGRCRNQEKRKAMLKDFGEWGLTMFFRGTVYLFLFILTIWGTIWALDFNGNHRIKFYPPDEVVDYLTAEHESLEAAAYQITPSAGKQDNIPLERFNSKCIETVKPIRIYADKYGIYLMTSKGWYNGEHGIFIAKDKGKMPPDINWGLIEGRIYTYAIYD
jgi:hypothetical protein